jgi:hypothetical protein
VSRRCRSATAADAAERAFRVRSRRRYTSGVRRNQAASGPQGGLRCAAMAIFHRATITPTKAELIAEWAPTRPWGPSAADRIEVIGSYRFDDPDGRVGMETHLVAAGGALL